MVTQPVQWHELDEVDSTNLWMLQRVKTASRDSQLSVLAHRQTAGRGRAGRAWHSQEGASLCMSVAMACQHPVPACLSVVVGVALAQTLNGMQPAGRLGLKWPNDLVLNGGKLGGVLCETVSHNGTSWLVVGVGMNLSGIQPSLSPGALPVAHWLPAGQAADSTVLHSLWTALTPAILSACKSALSTGFGPWQSQFNALDVWRGEPVEVLSPPAEPLMGQACGCNEQGEYVLLCGQQLHCVRVGDLSLRRRDA